MSDVSTRASAVRLMVFDVDGILTDGTLYLSDSGEEIKGFNILDGQGLKMLAASGVSLALITSRRSRVVERRAENLGIQNVFQGVEDKRATFESLHGRMHLEARACGYMGDDLVDLPIMLRCGFAISVPEAPDIVRGHAHYVTRRSGGRGAVREACELIMKTQGTYSAAVARYLD